VHFRTKVARARLVLAVQEHAGERRKAERRHRSAQVQAGLHVDHRFDAWLQREAVGAGRARGIEQCMDHQRGRLGRRALDPELDESGKLLALGAHRVDGQAACRQSVVLPLAERAEVARTQKHDQLVLVGGRVQRVVHAKSGQPQITPVLR
jgi:hypothetical protein